MYKRIVITLWEYSRTETMTIDIFLFTINSIKYENVELIFKIILIKNTELASDGCQCKHLFLGY